MTRDERRRRAMDWFIAIGTGLAVLALMGTLALTIFLQFANRQLLQDNRQLTVDNLQILAHSNRNHADSLTIERELRTICAADHVKCLPLP